MKSLLVKDIRNSFVDYFVQNGHQFIESSSIIPENDETLLFTNAGMVQFKNYFLGLEQPVYDSVVTIQKCLRAGGKHNDLENVGYTNRHHTFFEMLGNFSFGRYFKEQAIWYAWDYLVNVLELSKEKLIITVYYSDVESYNIWKKITHFGDDQILRLKSNDNFWSMGDVGPCGPCTEIFYCRDENLPGGLPGSIDENSEKYLEIWNIVFMQYHQLEDGSYIDLKVPCVDTGMGLERIASVLQGVDDNYENDTFKKIINYQENILEIQANQDNYFIFKILADHIRACSFMITSGITPSNEGRGYVLRRIMRRAMRYIYMLDIKEPIFYKLFNSLKSTMGAYYRELINNEFLIINILKNEELKFQETFYNGIKILEQEILKVQGSVFSGETAFKLYDTYGFPLDLTIEVLNNNKLTLNYDEWDIAFKHHKQLAKASWKGSGEQQESKIWFDIKNQIQANQFVGYDQLTVNAQVLFIVMNDENNQLCLTNSMKAGEEGYIVTDKTPFYPEKGGQAADTGLISYVEEEQDKDFLLEVVDTQVYAGELYVNKVICKENTLQVGTKVLLSVDDKRRYLITANHTATHLLHSALRNYFGSHVTQRGSNINDKRIRFDFAHNYPITETDILKIEEYVNNIVLSNLAVEIAYMSKLDAINAGALALFGEKYPDVVRTIKIDHNKFNTPVSFELCGGTHVAFTGDIGLFKIIAEKSVAQGIRRIEAVCNTKVIDYVYELNHTIDSYANALDVNSNNILDAINKLNKHNKDLKLQLHNIKTNYYSLWFDKYIEVYSNIQLLFGNLCSDKHQVKDVIELCKQRNQLLALLLLKQDGKLYYFLYIAKDLLAKIDIISLHNDIKLVINGTGGGKKNTYQGSGDIIDDGKLKSLLLSYL